MTKQKEEFHKTLKGLMDTYVHNIYNHTKTFPKDELFGVTSQIRRSALSVVLNYVEGYARQGRGELKQFLKISYGSLKESRYLVEFSKKQGYLKSEVARALIEIADKIGAMLWGIISKL